jgi:hypothetical protein
MANDFRGDVEDFAIVVPVPTLIEREQINVADRTLPGGETRGQPYFDSYEPAPEPVPWWRRLWQ